MALPFTALYCYSSSYLPIAANHLEVLHIQKKEKEKWK